MPYALVGELPKHVQKYTTKVKSQWRHVFNTVYSKTNDEGRAMMAANSVLKKRMSKDTYSNDYMNHLVDKWLGNLNG